MSQFSRIVFDRADCAVLSWMVGLLSACATFVGVSTTVVFGNSPAENAAASISKHEQFVAPREARPVYRKYAQFFSPFEALFGPTRQDSGPPGPSSNAPRQNFNSSPADDGRNDTQASAVKLKVIQQLRTAPPVPPTHGPLLLIVSIPKQLRKHLNH